MDYQFFQLLSERIEKAAAEDKPKLAALREKLLALTQEVDLEMQAQTAEVKKLLDGILDAPDVPAAFEKAIPAINELFVEVLRNELETAQRSNDQARLSKLQVVVDLLQKASTPPPGYALIDELLSAKTDAERQQILENHRSEVTQEFLDTLNGVVAQVESQGSGDKDKELVEALQASYRAALRFSMQSNLLN
jgi:hypothetical protein